MSSEAFVGEIQSVVLEERVEFQEKPHTKASSGIRSRTSSLLRALKHKTLDFKTIQNLKVVLMKKCSQLLRKKSDLIPKSINHKHKFWQSRPIKFSKNGWKDENMDIEQPAAETQWFFENLAEEF